MPDNRMVLEQVRRTLLTLHQQLLAAERIAWEAMHGRVAGNAELLQLAIRDPWFLWLRPMTALIAAIDEAFLEPESGTERDARLTALLSTARDLLHPDDQGSDFQQRYFDLLQRFPDVAVAHGAFITALHAAER